MQPIADSLKTTGTVSSFDFCNVLDITYYVNTRGPSCVVYAGLEFDIGEYFDITTITAACRTG